MTDVVLGLDVGTTSAKAAAFSSDGTEHGSGEAGYELSEPSPGAAVFDDVEGMVDAAVGALADAARAAVDGGCSVSGVCVSAAMHGLCGLDAEGRPATPLITWADTRAAGAAEEIRASHPGLHQRTGTPIHPMSPLVKLRWLRETDRALFDSVTCWVGVKELVLRRLTGELALDASCASGTGLVALSSGDWDDEALSVAGVSRSALPPLVATTDRVGDGLRADVAGRCGLEAGVPVVAGAGDGPLANLGVGAVDPGVAACSIGTSGALRVAVEAPAVDRAGRIFCYALVPGRWVVGGAINNGGNVLEWARGAFGGPSAEALLSEAADVPAGSDGLVMLPYLLSERAPHWSALPLGAYVGLTHAHGRGHLVRAALEGVCQQLSLVLASVRDAGNEVRSIRATGGFAQSPLWRQMLADVLGMAVSFPTAAQGTAYGAALLGRQALGEVDAVARAASLVEIGETVQPDPDAAALYAERAPIFERLYTDLAPAFRAIRSTR